MSESVFGNLNPAEASRRGVEARQRKRAEQPSDLTPAEQIEAAMQKKAMAGDVNAAREYREWMKLNRQMEVRGINGDILRLLNREQRKVLRGWIADAPPGGYKPRPLTPEERKEAERQDREVSGILVALAECDFVATHRLDGDPPNQEEYHAVAIRYDDTVRRLLRERAARPRDEQMRLNKLRVQSGKPIF
jgi:hypothetical protein